jgi:DNA-binding FadR family transcriptional regulator
VDAGSGTTIRRPSLPSVSRCFSLYLGAGGGMDLRKAAETRRLLLSDVCALAAERHSEEDLERLAGILREAESERGIPLVFVRWAAAFHAALAKAAANEVAGTLISMLDDQLQDAAVRAGENPLVTDRWLRHLQTLMKPLRKRDAKGARQGMRDMLIEIEDALVLTPRTRRA